MDTVAEFPVRDVRLSGVKCETTRVYVVNRSQKPFETEAQAAAWVVRLEADPSAAQLAQWQHWVSESVRRHAAYVRLADSWQRTECLRRLRPLDGEVRMDLLDNFP